MFFFLLPPGINQQTNQQQGSFPLFCLLSSCQKYPGLGSGCPAGMLARKLQPTPLTYVALINSCKSSEWPRALHFWHQTQAHRRGSHSLEWHDVIATLDDCDTFCRRNLVQISWLLALVSMPVRKVEPMGHGKLHWRFFGRVTTVVFSTIRSVSCQGFCLVTSQGRYRAERGMGLMR